MTALLYAPLLSPPAYEPHGHFALQKIKNNINDK